MNFADQEEIAERQKRRGKKRRNNVLWNSLTAIFLLASLAAVGFFLVIFTDPSAAINPFPPPTLPALIQIPTATNTPAALLPTATFLPTVSSTQPAVPTESTALPVEQTPKSATPTVNTTDFLFAIKGNPVGMTNTTFHPNLDCNWQGVAGKVTDIQGKAISNLVLRLTGTYNGETIKQETLSGGAANWIGEGGYEIVLEVGNAPLASTGELTIQLLDYSNIPLSDKVSLNTFAECDKNLILINFQQVN